MTRVLVLCEFGSLNGGERSLLAVVEPLRAWGFELSIAAPPEGPLADALREMPVVARGGQARVSERLNDCRRALRDVETRLWKHILARARWRSPLLVMDEAHHLKNPGTAQSRQLQSADLEQDLSVGDGDEAHAIRLREGIGSIRGGAAIAGSDENHFQRASHAGAS